MWLYFKEDIIVTECQGKLAQLARYCPARKVKVWCPSSGTQGLYGLILRSIILAYIIMTLQDIVFSRGGAIAGSRARCITFGAPAHLSL